MSSSKFLVSVLWFIFFLSLSYFLYSFHQIITLDTIIIPLSTKWTIKQGKLNSDDPPSYIFSWIMFSLIITMFGSSLFHLADWWSIKVTFGWIERWGLSSSSSLITSRVGALLHNPSMWLIHHYWLIPYCLQPPSALCFFFFYKSNTLKKPKKIIVFPCTFFLHTCTTKQ